MRAKARRSKLESEIRHEINQQKHYGERKAYDYLCEITEYAFGALSITKPYARNGEVLQADKEEHFRWQAIIRDLLALRMPYEMPRLAAVAIKHENVPDDGEYETIWEMRAKLIKRGLPVDHLDVRLLPYPESDDAGVVGTDDGIAG